MHWYQEQIGDLIYGRGRRTIIMIWYEQKQVWAEIVVHIYLLTNI